MPDSRAELERVISHALLEKEPSIAAGSMDRLPLKEVASFLASARPAFAAQALEAMDPDRAAALLESMTPETVGPIISQSGTFRMSLIVSRLGESALERVLQSVDSRITKELRAQMAYPAGSAAFSMDPRFIAFTRNTPMRDVIRKLKTIRKRQILDVIIVDEEGRLVGVAPLQKVILSDPAVAVGEVAVPGASIGAFESRDEVAELLERQRVTTLPVVDIHQRVIGVIRYESLLKAVRDDAASDLQAMVGVSRDERALSSPLFSVRKRLPWLNINLLTAFLAASVVGLFESVIAQFTALAVLLPVVAGQSGNTGAQAQAVTMRGLALREIRIAQWLRILRKECIAGALNGVAVALVTAAGVFVWSRSPGLCLVIGLAMILSMIIASVSGAAIPLILTRIGQDPATSSSIILTTVTDVLGFFSFLGLATLFSGFL